MVAANTLQVKSYPALSAAAIRAGYPAAARLYDLVQFLAACHHGREFFSRSDLTSLHLLDEHALDRALREGCGLFWTRADDDWHMTARSKVAAALGVWEPGQAVALPVAAFRGRLSGYKAHVYAGFVAQMRRNTPSREILCQTFGISLPTLLEWERRIPVTVRPRYVHVDPFEGGQAEVYNQSLELVDHRPARVWISIVSPRGKVIAGRRLMDNDNHPLGDFWSVQDEPGWEPGSRPVLTFQTTNEYVSDIPTTAGRSRRLRAEIKRYGSPASRPGGKPQRYPARWFDEMAGMVKWQGKRFNRDRAAIVVTRRTQDRVIGTWSPSRVAFWNEP